MRLMRGPEAPTILPLMRPASWRGVAVTRVTVTERGCGVWEGDVRTCVGTFQPAVSSFRGCNERVLIKGLVSFRESYTPPPNA